MRTRQQIEKDHSRPDILALEVLLDIRDLLEPKGMSYAFTVEPHEEVKGVKPVKKPKKKSKKVTKIKMENKK